jgi:hypothetical protein
VEYCVNDVEGTEKTFADREQDFVARQILAELSGLPVNAPTAKHTAKIIFGNDRNPVSSFVYTDLSEQFPGYKFEMGKSSYRGEDPGEGGYVYAEPGHVRQRRPSGRRVDAPDQLIEPQHVRGLHTELQAAARRSDWPSSEATTPRLARCWTVGWRHICRTRVRPRRCRTRLKIVINIVYGLTSAKFDNPFRDNRNKDNIVAKRGALFMIDLKQLSKTGHDCRCTSRPTRSRSRCDQAGHQLRHGVRQGLRLRLRARGNVRRILSRQRRRLYRSAGQRQDAKWTAVGAQFQHPYVFKTLFTKEEVGFADLVETKQVTKGAMYIDFEGREEPTRDQMQFIGRFGSFIPVTAESGLGGTLYRVSEEDKRYAVTGTKGYLWMESALAAHQWPEISESIDWRYYEGMAEDAITAIDFWGPFEHFVNG